MAIGLTPPVKLFIGLLYREEPYRTEAKELMGRRWGVIDYESDPVLVTLTGKVNDALGPPIFRSFVGFRDLVDPGEINLVKIECIGLETRLRSQGKPKIFLDPGYLNLQKVVMTSGESGPAKIYHSAGIYLDLAVLFSKDKCQSFPWGDAEFKNHLHDEHLLAMRELYRAAVKPQG